MRVRCAGLVALAMLAMWPLPTMAQTPMMYPPAPYAYRFAGPESNLRLAVSPKEAAVYVDGYFVGQVDRSDGIFQRLHVAPGDHDLVIFLTGYHSLHQAIRLRANETQKISGKLRPLAAGEANEPTPVPLNPPEADQGQPPPGPALRRGFPPPYPPAGRGFGAPGRGAEPANGGQNSPVGTVAIRVLPLGTGVLIDGQAWDGPTRDDERLTVQLSEGRHTIEIRRQGYQEFSTEVDVRRGETTPINISLTPER